jgi:hypothetical protein
MISTAIVIFPIQIDFHSINHHMQGFASPNIVKIGIFLKVGQLDLCVFYEGNVNASNSLTYLEEALSLLTDERCWGARRGLRTPFLCLLTLRQCELFGERIASNLQRPAKGRSASYAKRAA